MPRTCKNSSTTASSAPACPSGSAVTSATVPTQAPTPRCRRLPAAAAALCTARGRASCVENVKASNRWIPAMPGQQGRAGDGGNRLHKCPAAAACMAEGNERQSHWHGLLAGRQSVVFHQLLLSCSSGSRLAAGRTLACRARRAGLLRATAALPSWAPGLCVGAAAGRTWQLDGLGIRVALQQVANCRAGWTATLWCAMERSMLPLLRWRFLRYGFLEAPVATG